MTICFRGGLIVTPTGILFGGQVLVDGGVISAVVPDGAGLDRAVLDRAVLDRAGVEVVELAGRYLLPGFIDLHVHGGGGASFDDGSEAIAAGLATHRAQGTTASMISLLTAPLDAMVRAVAGAAEYAATDPSVLGLHLEGAFLSDARRGVHPRSALLDPDPVALQQLLRAGAGEVQVMTVAPEGPGGLNLVRQLKTAGVHAAVGHSDAGYDVAAQAFWAGADLVTHACNGMRPMHHRDPGIIGAAMDAGVVLEVVNDGFHLHDAMFRLLWAIAPGRMALVTDAMAGAGLGDGMHRLGELDVRVDGGRAALADGTLAGSTLTIAAAVRRAVHQIGVPLVEAANAASLVPATWLGQADRIGSIRPGRVADLVIADLDLAVEAVLAGGRWVDDRR